MANPSGEAESVVESVMDKKFRGLHSSSSSSDSDNKKASPFSAVKSNMNRLFGREQPVHKLLGGGKSKTGPIT